MRSARRRAPALVALAAVAALLVGCTGGTGAAAPPGAQSPSTVLGAGPGGAGATTTGTPTSPVVTVPSISSGSGSAPGGTSPVSTSDPSTATSTASSTQAPPVAVISAKPAFGSTGVSPRESITITVAKGRLDALTLTNPDGKTVKGELSADHTSWTVGEELGYGKTYTATGSATGDDGRKVPVSGTFRTVSPTTQVRTTISPGDDAKVGVAAVVVVSFGVKPQDRALIERNVSITTQPKVEGAWAWIQHDGGTWGLDFRPKTYWPAGTKVHVQANVYGLKFADGAYGKTDLSSDFTIGRNQVVYADVNSHELVVKRDGKVSARYPASYGRGTDANTTTRSGIHVVNEFFEDKLMSNPRYGYVNIKEKWAVRISNNGEFIHANPASASAQGNTNVTHGCVNLSLADAEKYFKSALIGDPVEVTGTKIALGPSDGDVFDWAVPWSEWKTLSALS